MGRRSRTSNWLHDLRPDSAPMFLGQDQSINPRHRLWMLRLLVLGGAHARFIIAQGYQCVELADTLGLSTIVPEVDENFPRRRAFDALCQMHSEAETAERVSRSPLPTILECNLSRLRALCGLSDLDCELLAFTILMLHEHTFYEVGGYFTGLTALRTYELLGLAIGYDREAVAAALAVKSNLVRTGLLRIDTTQRFPLNCKIDPPNSTFCELIMAREVNPLDLLRGYVQAAAPAELTLEDFDYIPEIRTLLLPYIRQVIMGQSKGCNVILHGPVGTGKTQLVRTIAQAADALPVYEVAYLNAAREPIRGQERLRSWQLGQELLAGSRAVLCFDEFSDVVGSDNPFEQNVTPVSKGFLTQAMENSPILTFFILNDITALDPAYTRRADIVLEVKNLTVESRARMIKDLAGDIIEESAVRSLSAVEAVSPAIVRRARDVVERIYKDNKEFQRDTAFRFLIAQNVRAQTGQLLRLSAQSVGLPEFYDVSLTNADVDLEALASGLSHARSGRILLMGPPGSGKTAIGRWLAQRLDVPLQVERASTLLGGVVSETERNIAAAFARSRRDGSLFLLDEADSFLFKRSSAVRSWEVSMVNELLVQLEEAKESIVVLSTNSQLSDLDEAFSRRMDLKIRCDYLRPQQSIQLLRTACRTLGLAEPPPEALKMVSQIRMLTPGDFQVVIRQAQFRRCATVDHFLQELGRESAQKIEGLSRPIGFVS